jgi:hypothetical protein
MFRAPTNNISRLFWQQVSLAAQNVGETHWKTSIWNTHTQKRKDDIKVDFKNTGLEILNLWVLL